MALDTLHDLFVHELKDLYSAEKQLTRALPKMVKAASSAELKSAFSSHLRETEHHVERLEQIFSRLDVSPRGSKCDAMEGLIDEGGKMIKEDAAAEVKDAGLICAAQRVEHYEIAAYGCVRAFAELLEESHAVKLLQQTLDEESAANEALTGIAEHTVNPAAVAADVESADV